MTDEEVMKIARLPFSAEMRMLLIDHTPVLALRMANALEEEASK